MSSVILRVVVGLLVSTFASTSSSVINPYVTCRQSPPVSLLALGPGPIALGDAGNFTILAESGISTVPNSVISTLQHSSLFIPFLINLSQSSAGPIGISPAAATAITGFGLILAPGRTYSTSTQVTGDVYAANYANPTPAYLTKSIADMGTAYSNASPSVLEPPNYTPASGKLAFRLHSTST